MKKVLVFLVCIVFLLAEEEGMMTGTDPQEELPEQQEERVSVLMKKIETEYVAMKQAMSAYGMQASHEFINARFKAVDQSGAYLEEILGESSKRLLFEQYQKTFD